MEAKPRLREAPQGRLKSTAKISWVLVSRVSTANMNWMKSYSFSRGSTHIVPGNFGGTSATGQTNLLVYNATSGGASFWDVWARADMNWEPGYSQFANASLYDRWSLIASGYKTTP
jgi:hypothetical protein